jgi:hypothetical protein
VTAVTVARISRQRHRQPLGQLGVLDLRAALLLGLVFPWATAADAARRDLLVSQTSLRLQCSSVLRSKQP